MKEFNKWLKTDPLKGIIENEFLDRESVSFHSALQTWKAVLEWVLERANYVDGIVVIDNVKEELNES